MSVVIETTVGDLTVDLYLKERRNTCLNFLKLCKVKYYNLCIFHKVERNFIAQTGDPTSTGRGGESIFSRLYGDQATYFEAELKPRLKHEKLGTLSMVNNGNSMNGSQFFLTLGENLTYLDEVHTVFGELVEGFETLLKINEAICDPNNRPYQDIRITHTVVLHDPYDDPAALEIPDASPLPTREQLESNYIGADEEIDDTEGKTAEEVEEKIKESEAKARATILEMVGDLPDADVKPPENVLFVCKLNPVTTSEDLEIIFSRFGTITSCEVIKDKKTGESLQYAFIEFEKEEDCENAYFKMDNVLIDDRRIHVDFSQSVSKLSYDVPQKFARGTNARNRSFVIKGNEKKSDGYDMIFDMDNGLHDSKQEKKKGNNSGDQRHKRYDSSTHSNRERSQKSSDSFNRDHKRFKDSSSYQSRKFEDRPKSGSSKDRRHGSDIKSSHFSVTHSPSVSQNKTSSRKNRTRHVSSSNEAYSSDNAPSKTVKSYSKKKGRHDSSSSNHSVSLSPPRQNRSKHKSSYRTENSSHSPEFYHHQKTPKHVISASCKDKERKHGFSRHRSRSLDSVSPKRTSKQVPSQTRLYSLSPESFKSKTYKSKHVSSRRRSKSITPQRHKKAGHCSSKKRSSSPESSYHERTKPKEMSSLKHQLRSSNSSSPEQRRGYAVEKSDSMSRSSKKHTSRYDSHATRSLSKSPKVVDHTRVFRHGSPIISKYQDRKRNSSISSDSEFEVKTPKTKNKKHKSSSSKTEKHHHAHKKHKHSKSYS